MRNKVTTTEKKSHSNVQNYHTAICDSNVAYNGAYNEPENRKELQTTV